MDVEKFTEVPQAGTGPEEATLIGDEETRKQPAMVLIKLIGKL